MNPLNYSRLGVFAALSIAALSARADEQPDDVTTAWDLYRQEALADRSLAFDVNATGVKTPILWGFDTAWNDRGNMLRGVRYCGADVVSCARVSFQPWAEITTKGVLPQSLKTNLQARMTNVGLIGKKVDIVLNLDGGDPTVKEVYGGWKYENPDDPWNSPKEYIGNVVEQGPKWADLIDATAAAVEAMGYKVITASPLNEPDLEINGTPIELFYEIARNLKDYDRYPRFRDIRISGGNTLNDDEAMRWYEYNKEYLDEGNTHQLAGNFDNYAAFFTKVREDGKHASADELHNVMEAIVGVEYGMQTGIWWGTAEQCRGEFMKASGGDRLSYAENRDAWSAGAVYRSPAGKIQGFLGCSERQAKPSTYRFVSLDGDMYMDGFGPVREYTVQLPADPSGAYQTEKQRNAETVINITRGDDIMPYITGQYALINQADHNAASTENGSGSNGTYIVPQAYTKASNQLWNISRVPNDNGGDFSYYFIRTLNGKSMDDYNWNIEINAPVRLYDHSGGNVQQWALEYDGDNWFHIRNRNSGLYLEYQSAAAGAHLVQKERTDAANQKWRLLPSSAPLEFDAPSAPSGLRAEAGSASVLLTWQPSTDNGKVTYNVLRAAKGSDDYNTVARGLSATSFRDNSIIPGEYSYKILAVDASGNRSATGSAANVTVGADHMLVANFPFVTDGTDLSGNQFSIKSPSAMTFKDGALNMRGLFYAQLPYSLLEGDSFTMMMRTQRGNQNDGITLFSTGTGRDEYLKISLCDGGQTTMTSVNGDLVESTSGPAVEYLATAHVTLRVTGGKAALFIDGNAVGSEITAPEHRVLHYLFRDMVQTSGYYRGTLNDLQVYNYAMSDAEITAAANNGAGVDDVTVSACTVVSIEYYTPQGIRIAEPAAYGITIERIHYSDGSIETRKRIAN